MNERGFTLVEVLVASVVFTIFMVGILNLLDTSTKVSQLENSVADAQENVRFAAYHIMRTARMIRGATMPVAANVAGTDEWVTAELRSNQSGTVNIPGYIPGLTVKPGSDVLTLRGFFEISPFFTNPTTVTVDSTTVSVSEFDAGGLLKNDFSAFTVGALEGRGIVFMGQGSYCVGVIDAGSTETNPGNVNNTLEIKHTSDPAFWGKMNTQASYPPSFQIYRVGVLESYTYYVNPDNELRPGMPVEVVILGTERTEDEQPPEEQPNEEQP